MRTLPELSGILKRQRKALGWSQAELARRAGVGRSTLDALENERLGELGFVKVARILAVLGLELEARPFAPHRPTLDDLLEEDRHDEDLDRRR
jgi:transcriptional regulator with XRE-family HTH domain